MTEGRASPFHCEALFFSRGLDGLILNQGRWLRRWEGKNSHTLSC